MICPITYVKYRSYSVNNKDIYIYIFIYMGDSLSLSSSPAILSINYFTELVILRGLDLYIPSLLCTSYIVQCTFSYVHRTLYSVHSAMYIVRFLRLHDFL